MIVSFDVMEQLLRFTSSNTFVRTGNIQLTAFEWAWKVLPYLFDCKPQLAMFLSSFRAVYIFLLHLIERSR